MRPEFVNFNVVGKDGRITEMPINPMNVCMIMPIEIAGKMVGPTGEPVMKAAAALDFGTNAVPVDHTLKEAQRMLEGKKVDNLRTEE